LRKGRYEKEIPVPSVAYKRICRSKSASGKLNEAPLERLEKFKKSSLAGYCFRPKRLMATVKNVIASSGLGKTLIRFERLQCV